MGRWVFHLGPHPVRRSIQPISNLRGYSQTTVAEWGLGKQGRHCDHIGPESEGRAGNDNPINLYNGDARGAIIVPPGYADPIRFEDGGNPYGNSCTISALSDTGKKSVVFKSERLVNFARKIMD